MQLWERDGRSNSLREETKLQKNENVWYMYEIFIKSFVFFLTFVKSVPQDKLFLFFPSLSSSLPLFLLSLLPFLLPPSLFFILSLLSLQYPFCLLDKNDVMEGIVQVISTGYFLRVKWREWGMLLIMIVCLLPITGSGNIGWFYNFGKGV